MNTSTALHYRLQHVDDHTLLACDPPGGVRIVEAFGDVAMADHIAIVVPGNGHHLGNYFTDRGPVSPRTRGELVRDAMAAQAPGERVAVVVWVGYRTPAGMASAFSNRYARDGAGDLARLTHYLPRSAHLTLIGHSYGSAVCGLALPAARVEDCVALGSAGVGVSRRDELGTGTRLWAAQTETDWIRFFPHGRVGPLGLGRPPLHPAIQARRFGTGDITGHCGYYTAGSESVRNIARIAVGRYAEVTPAGVRAVATAPAAAMEVAA
ncbi:alpha/beta hydrolase [Flexivirga oryzae]|uniref:DUF1023 domain-containing protein n=1 Tax=Flexivirga oryzae TaxID=1794944 RepID=A0A839ND14_9MICO|nr:alpha/beta hydrolase [Flexivirga oryzae]MBB2893075.1 hypothetical protein [Flexivirga oryzae]